MTIKRSGDERRIQIARAALKIVSEHGIKKFTTSTLAKEVGLAEGTIFKHFSSKKEIIDSAIEQVQTMFFTDLPSCSQEPLESLGLFFKQRATFALEKPNFVKIIQADQLNHSATPKGVEMLKDMKQQSINFIQACLKEASNQNKIKPGISLNVLTFLIYSSVASLANLGDEFLTTSKESIDSIWETIVNLISA
jgi:AcrR family transcriptional regulator